MNRNRFDWSAPAKWPKNTPEYVFLARAIHQIGEAVHGGNWSEEINPKNIFVSSKGTPLRTQSEASLMDRRNAALLMGKNVGSNNREPDELTPDEWKQAQELGRISNIKAAETRKAAIKRRDMWLSIAEQVADALRNGRLESGMREPNSTQILGPQNRDSWNIDDVSECFARCARNISLGYDSGGKNRFVFISSQSLAYFLEGVRASSPPTNSEPFLFDKEAHTWGLFTCIAYLMAGVETTTVGAIYGAINNADGSQRFDVAFERVASMLASGAVSACGVSPTHNHQIREIPASIWGRVVWEESTSPGITIISSRVALDAIPERWSSAVQSDVYTPDRGQPRWVNVCIERALFLSKLQRQERPSVQGLRRAAERYDWPSFHEKLGALMDHHGAINPVDPEWNNRAKVINVMTDWCVSEWGVDLVPGETSIRNKINGFLDSWQQPQ